MTRNQLSLVFWIALLGAWGIGACALIAPVGGQKPVEEITLTPSLPASPTALAPTAAPPALRIETRQLQESQADPRLVVFAQFPALASEAVDERTLAFDSAVERLLFDDLAVFKQTLTQNPPPAELAALDSTFLTGYSVQSATDALVSVRFNISSYYAGAAHPFPYTLTLNIDLRSNRVLELADLFQPGSDYLERISQISLRELEKTGMMDNPDGAAAREENFARWVINPAGLTIIFDVYQVAAYAAGPQEVLIPWSDLTDLLSEDWRIPLSASALSVDQADVPVRMP